MKGVSQTRIPPLLTMSVVYKAMKEEPDEF
jgi:hypothetical protein